MFFLNGPGGTGKTFVYNTVVHKVRSEGWIALCVASSGVASLLLHGGPTSHSMYYLPVSNPAAFGFIDPARVIHAPNLGPALLHAAPSSPDALTSKTTSRFATPSASTSTRERDSGARHIISAAQACRKRSDPEPRAYGLVSARH